MTEDLTVNLTDLSYTEDVGGLITILVTCFFILMIFECKESVTNISNLDPKFGNFPMQTIFNISHQYDIGNIDVIWSLLRAIKSLFITSGFTN